MRSMLNTEVVFGVVSVPVKVYSAYEEQDVELHTVHKADGGKIRYRRVCEVCGPDLTIEQDEITKGYETSTGEVVVLSPELIEEVNPKGSKEVQILEFVSVEQIDPLLYNRRYYLGPGTRGERAYAVLRAALQRTPDRLALVKVALRGPESLAVLRVAGPAIVMQTLLWPDQVRKTDEVTELAAVTSPDADDPTVSMAVQLIGAMVADFQPEKYTDERVKAMRELIAKLETAGELARKRPEPAPVPDTSGAALLAQLEASVGATKSDG